MHSLINLKNIFWINSINSIYLYCTSSLFNFVMKRTIQDALFSFLLPKSKEVTVNLYQNFTQKNLKLGMCRLNNFSTENCKGTYEDYTWGYHRKPLDYPQSVRFLMIPHV